MSRIETTFEALRARRRCALIAFVTAGDPSLAVTLEVMHALAAAGADVLELGVPFSDPQADGPTIQRASERALAGGTSLRKVLELVREFRATDARTPVVLMGYANPFEAMGHEAFAAAARAAGVDGVLIVDLPPEESRSFADRLAQHGIDMIFLLAPTSTEARVAEIGRLASGYVYYVSLTGVTGAKHLESASVAERIPQLRRHVRVPIGVGFGIRDAERAREVAAVADAVVIGSRIVEEIERSTPAGAAAAAAAFVRGIRAAIDA